MEERMKQAILTSSSGERMLIKVGKKVRWHQRGLNRYLEGKITKIENPYNHTNHNMYKVTVKLNSGAVVNTRAWQFL